MNIENYTIEDFLMDESFQQWVLNQDDRVEAEWKQGLAEFPEKNKTMDEAKNIFWQIKASVENEIDTDEEEIWLKIENSINPHFKNNQ